MKTALTLKNDYRYMIYNIIQSKQYSVTIHPDDQSSTEFGIYRINITFGKKENDTWDKLTASSEDSTSYTQNYKWEK